MKNISLKTYAAAMIPVLLFAAALFVKANPARAQCDPNDTSCQESQYYDSSSYDSSQPASSPAPSSPSSAGVNSSGQATVTGNPNSSGQASVTGNPNSSGNATVNPQSQGGMFYLQNPLCQNTSNCQFNTVGGIVSGFIQIFVYLVILLAVLMIIWVGLQLVLAQGNAERIKELKKQLLWLVVGVAVVIGARIIVQVVISTLQATGTINQTVITNSENALHGQ